MIKVFGDGLDAVITINLLLKSGHEVSHYSKVDKFGGHFRGSQNCGGNFDLGMVLLEPDFIPTASVDLSDYKGEFGRHSRVFLKDVFEWLEGQVGNLIEQKVKTLLAPNQEIADYFIGDSLEFLNTLDNRQKVELEARIIPLVEISSDRSELHPAKKITSQFAADTPLTDLLEEFYGEEIYQKYFQGFVLKVTGASQPAISARDNRRIWLPNYYPESILFALTQDLKYSNYELKPLRFLRPEEGQIADFVLRLQDENNRNKSYQLVKIDKLPSESDLKESNSYYFLNISDFAKSDKHGFQFAKNYTKQIENPVHTVSNSINITHFCVARCDPKTVFVAEETNEIIRYSYYSGQSGSAVSIESIPGKVEPKTLSLQLMARDGLTAVCDGHSHQVPLRIRRTEFTLEEWNEFINLVGVEYPTLNKTFFLVHPEANTFNDNLLRGLAAFRKREFRAS